MDLFKRNNVNKATSFDFNAKCVNLRDRRKTHKLLNKLSRTKIKRETRQALEEIEEENL